MSIKDPKQMMMVYLMPLMMIFFFWSMSSGLVLYWTLFNLLSWAQQVVIQEVQKARKG
jgi:YidC/Oxa1 family membrane protein insertase